MPIYFRSDVPDGEPPELGDVFPTALADPEQLVYDAVKAAVTKNSAGVAKLGFYASLEGRDPAAVPEIPVVAGWPAYPGTVPAIGVAAGPETEDKGKELQSGGFARDVVEFDAETGEPIGSASYYAEPLYSTVIVELIHENRDERDRLHNELRRVMFPLRRKLPQIEKCIQRVTVDAEKTEQGGGPPMAEQPFMLYISVFTVHVYHEMLEATDVGGPDTIIGRIDAETPAP